MQAVKKDGVPRGTIPVVLMRNLAVGNTYTIIIYVHGGKQGNEVELQSLFTHTILNAILTFREAP